MKKTFYEIKSILTAFWMTLISFSSKAMGQELYWAPPFLMDEMNMRPEPMYWVEYNPEMYKPELLLIIAKIASLLLVVLTFVFWIISFIRIRKIDDRNLKKKKIKNTIIIISILVILIVVIILLPRFLKKYL